MIYNIYKISYVCTKGDDFINTTTTISKWGSSRAIRLPKQFLERLDLRENDTVDIILDDNKIIIKKKYQHKTLKQRVEEFYGKDFESIVAEDSYEFEEVDSGQPIGGEIW